MSTIPLRHYIYPVNFGFLYIHIFPDADLALTNNFRFSCRALSRSEGAGDLHGDLVWWAELLSAHSVPGDQWTDLGGSYRTHSGVCESGQKGQEHGGINHSRKEMYIRKE